MELTAYPVGDGRRARHALYASHFLSMWGQRAWEFAVGLVMLEIRQSSLLLVSLFGLCDAAAVVLFGSAVGAYIDRCAAAAFECRFKSKHRAFKKKIIIQSREV